MPPHSKDSNNANATKSNRNQKDGATTPLSRDEHASVNEFNSKEIKAALQKSPEPKPTMYKLPKTENVGSRPGNGPWGSKANTMANGKDFFLELRKQVSAAQRASGNALGG